MSTIAFSSSHSKLDGRNVRKIACSYDFSEYSNSNSFRNNHFNFFIKFLVSHFVYVEHHSIKIFRRPTLTSESLHTQMDRKCKVFDFYGKSNHLLSKTTRCISSISVSIDFILLVKSYLIAKHCIWFCATKTWWIKIAKNWISTWFAMTIKLGFPQSNCQDFSCQVLNQQFCFCKWW